MQSMMTVVLYNDSRLVDAAIYIMHRDVRWLQRELWYVTV